MKAISHEAPWRMRRGPVPSGRGRRIWAWLTIPNVNLAEVREVRAGWMLLFFLAGFLVLGGRAFHLTVIQHEKWAEEAKRYRFKSLKLTNPRGEIFEANGDRLAGTREGVSVFADPKLVAGPDDTARQLAAILGLDAAELEKKLRAESRFVWVKKRIGGPEVEALTAAIEEAATATLEANKQAKEAAGGKKYEKIVSPYAGIRQIKEVVRTYPRGQLAAQVIGYVNHETIGKTGVEKYYEDRLAGQAGRIVALRDAAGNTYLPEGVQIEGRQPGKNIKLTIDANIQWFAEAALDGVVKEFRPAGAWAIVMDVRNGKILAMANRPTYDPGDLSGTNADARRNRAVLDCYEPGSTMKPLTMAAVLEDGKVLLDEKINCHLGSFRYGGHTIHDTHPIGWVTPETIIKESSNIGAARIALRLGAKRLNEWQRRYGFGERTGVDLPAETWGILRDHKKWYPIDVATQAYGQGVSVTALQLLTATAALGNGGRLMRPYVVEEITDADGVERHRTLPEIRRRVVSERVADEVLQMMRQVTTTGGTGTQAALNGISVAGKTGTAYKVIESTGRYHPTKRVGSFVGMVPGDRPILGIIVVVDEPVGKGFGGVVAAPAFREIAARSLDYLGVYAERVTEEQRLIAALADDMHATAKADQPEQPEKRLAARGNTAPDFHGMSIRKARRVAVDRGIDLTIEGTGVATKQAPAPGARLGDGRLVKLTFVAKR